MIDYTEKGTGLHAAIAASGHVLVQRDGVWTSSDDAAVQAIIDAYDPLPGAKLAKWRQIQAKRDQLKAGGYVTDGYRYHSDDASRIQQLGLVIMGANMPAGIMWKTADNGFVEMTPALAAAIFQTAATSDTQVFGAAEQHRAAVNALNTLEEIEAYDFSGGWPAV